MEKPSRVVAIWKLMVEGERAGLTLEQMIDMLEAGITTRDLLELIRCGLDLRSRTGVPNGVSGHWVM